LCYAKLKDPNEYIALIEAAQLSSWGFYAKDNQILVDFVGGYENLKGHLSLVYQKIGYFGRPVLGKTHRIFRRNHDHFSTVLGFESRKKIEAACSKEMELFGYSWDSDVGVKLPFVRED
jgi:hypothetical protein